MKPSPLALALSLVAAAAAAASETPDATRPSAWPAARRIELGAGAVAFCAEDRALPLVEVAVALRVGSFLDPPAKVGLASLAGALLRLGGAGELDAAAFDERADALGAELRSFSRTTRGAASLSVPSWNLEAGLDLLFAMLARPRFQEDRLETATARLRESMRRRNDDPLAILEREWEWLVLGPRHFSTRPVTAATVAAISRADLVALHAAHWRPERMVLAVSGDLACDRVAALMAPHLEAWPDPPAAAGDTPWPPADPDPAGAAGPGLYHVEAPFPQAKIALGHRVPRTPGWLERERFALELAAEILGGRGAISRLAARLRTAEGLAYRVATRYDLGDLWPGDFRIVLDTAPANAPRAVRLAIEEIRRMRARPVARRELEVARTTLTSRLGLAFDTAEEVAGYAAEDELLGRPSGYWPAYRETIPTITAEEVLAAAVALLRADELVVLVVGPWEQARGPIRDATSALERAAGRPVIHLPRRHPMTMEPPPGGEPSAPEAR